MITKMKFFKRLFCKHECIDDDDDDDGDDDDDDDIIILQNENDELRIQIINLIIDTDNLRNANTVIEIDNAIERQRMQVEIDLLCDLYETLIDTINKYNLYKGEYKNE